MPQRQIPHKHALDLVVAHAPVHPPQEHPTEPPSKTPRLRTSNPNFPCVFLWSAKREAFAFTVEARQRVVPQSPVLGIRSRLLLPDRCYLFSVIVSLQKQPRHSAQRPAEARSERREKSAIIPRGIRPHIQQLRRNPQCSPQQVGVHAK